MDETALHAARRRVAEAPDEPAGLFRLCRLLLERGDPEVNVLVERLERFASYAPGWCEIGITLLRAQQTRAALLAFNRAASADPLMAAAHAGRGLCLRQYDAAAAIEAFERAVALDASQADAWFGLGGLRQDIHDVEGAATAFRAALRARPRLHEAAFNLGVALLDCGRFEEALDAFGKALKTRPDSLGRIAQALVSGQTGCLWLRPERLLRALGA